MDKELYNNLQKLKNFEGNISDLGISFVIDDEITQTEIELIPGGKSIEVSNQNIISYLYHYADYKMNKTIRNQLNSFMAGFHKIINSRWLKIFCEEEIEFIVNGSESVIDVDDLINNATVQGKATRFGFIDDFRSVLKGFNNEKRRAFLKFVTSYRNPPLFGFETLRPPIKIRKLMFALLNI